MRRNQQQGVAVLTVLLVVAIGSALAFSLATQQTMVVAQSRQVLVGDQLRNLLLGGEILARQILREDWENPETRDHDNLLETWAMATPPFEIPGGFIEVQVRDLHNCFNLNSLSNLNTAPSGGGGNKDGGKANPKDDDTELFKNLFHSAGLQTRYYDLWRDWIDTDEQPVSVDGGEDGEYLVRNLAYRTPNSPAAHISEIRLLGEEQIELEQYRALVAAACVIPDVGQDMSGQQINVNTVTQATLEVLDPTIDLAKVQSLIESERNYTETESFIKDFGGGLTKYKGKFGTTSNFFEVSVRADLDGEKAEMVSTIYRDRTDGLIHLISRDYSRRFVSRLVIEIEEEDA